MAKPTSGAVLVARSEPRTRTALLLESVALRHQIAVLDRSRTRRPYFRRFDRLFWILFSRWWPQWRDGLIIVQPETVLRWRPIDLLWTGNSLSQSAKFYPSKALQERLHPAESRVHKLAAVTPAISILFDCLMSVEGLSLLDAPLRDRRTALEHFFDSIDRQAALKLTPFRRDYREAQRWLNHADGALDGVVAKRLDGLYQAGERAMLCEPHQQ